jgi:ABC-type multidrug transport system ATPase subunit
MVPSDLCLLTCFYPAQDVIALRKRSGTITGEVLVNGWPQERISFRRASGYVEQFDVQTPELTVRETVLFSAKLRLDPEYVETDEKVISFVDGVIKAVELTSLANILVGTDEGHGLSFEEKKRLSIAVELAASPSLLFLDEVNHYSSEIVSSHIHAVAHDLILSFCSQLADLMRGLLDW